MTFHKLEVANYLLVNKKKYKKNFIFWNQCEISYPMRPKVTFTLPEEAYDIPYFTQKYEET